MYHVPRGHMLHTAGKIRFRLAGAHPELHHKAKVWRKRRRRNGSRREILVRGKIVAHGPYNSAKRTKMNRQKRVLCVHFAYGECGICASFCYKEESKEGKTTTPAESKEGKTTMPAELLHFGPFRIDVANEQLWRE